MSALSDFYGPMRVLLQDNDTQQQENTDAMLLAGFQTSYLMGLWPAGYVLVGTTITPDVPIGKTFAIILLETVMAYMVGDQGAYSWSTRAMSETDHGERKRDILAYARQKIYDLRDGDACFSSRQAFVVFLNTICGFADLIDVSVTPNLDLNLALTADGIVTVDKIPPL